MSADVVADTQCPECAAGKHPNCHGDAWDQTTDAPGVCPCWVADHAATEPPQELVDRLNAVVHDAALVMKRNARTPDEVMADLAADRYEASLERGRES